MFRSNFLCIFDNTLKSTWVATLAIITNFAIIVKKINEFNLNFNTNLLIILILALFIIFVYIVNLISWKISRFEITDNMLIIYKNIFIKDRKEFLTNEISSICVSQNIFERIFKLVRVEIYQNEKNIISAGFKLVISKALFYNKIVPFLKARYIDLNAINDIESIKFSFVDILKHSFLSIPISAMIIIFNFIVLIFNMIGSGIFIKEVLDDFIGLIITLFIFVFPVIYSILRNVIKYCNYKIVRKKDYIYIFYGFVTKINYIIPVSKINGLIVDQSLLSSFFGYCKSNIILTGIGDRKNKLGMLFPISNKKTFYNILSKLLPEYNIDLKCSFQPFSAIIVICIKVAIVILCLILPVVFIDVFYVEYMVVLYFIIIFVLYFFKKVKICESYLCITTGIVAKRTVIFEKIRIESIVFKEGMLSRMFGLCKVSISIFGDVKNSVHSSGYIPS